MGRHRTERRGAWLALSLSVIAACPALAEPDPAAVAESLRRHIEMLQSLGRIQVAGEPILAREGLPPLYEGRGFVPLWAEASQVESLLGEISAADGDGLEPADYHFAALRRVIEARRQHPDDAGIAASVDLLLSDALVRLATHLHHGKLHADTLEPRWDLAPGEEAEDTLRRMVLSGAVGTALSELRPTLALYGRLKAALARYLFIAADGGWPSLGDVDVLRDGMRAAAVPVLRRRLALTGDYDGPATDSPLFDTRLADGLRAFQARHGLEPDGVLGPATRRALDEPVEARMDRIRANLERARWLLAGVRGRVLLLDPAGGDVRVVREGREVHAQAAGFGAPWNAAASFRSETSYAVANPDWVLPPAMVTAQVAPLARRSPNAIADLGLVVHDDRGRPVDAASVDWSRPDDLVVIQTPADRSLLGVLRIAVPGDPPAAVHGGGPGHPLAGSVRVADPLALAAVLLEDPTGSQSWTRAALGELAASGLTRVLAMPARMPVVYAPWTAWVPPDGTVSFRPGFRAQDSAIIAGLAVRAGASQNSTVSTSASE